MPENTGGSITRRLPLKSEKMGGPFGKIKIAIKRCEARHRGRSLPGARLDHARMPTHFRLIWIVAGKIQDGELTKVQTSQISRPLSLVLLLVLAPTAHGCMSSDEDRAEQQPAPPIHQPADVSPATPSGEVRRMEGMGNVDFAITTNSKEAQAFFNQGVAQLYGFWAFESERSFVQAAKLDPGAAMAYWGIAMAAPGNFVPMYQLGLTPNRGQPIVAPPNSAEARARAAIAKAQALGDSITPRERFYIEAVAAMHNPTLGDPDAAYIAGMKKLVESFPGDLEAKSILALALENGYDPSTKAPKGGTSESLRLLRQVLAKDPDHVGASHFWIHGLEGSKNLRDALPIAERYAAMVPNIPHALHMPGHVYAQIGMFDEAAKAFLATADKERAYISESARYSKTHYIHNEFLLLRVLEAQGRYSDAISHIADLMSGKEKPSENQPPDLFSRIGWFALMQTLVRFEKWNEIVDGKTLPFLDQPIEAIWYHWAQGLAYASTSQADQQRNSLQMMEESIRSLGRFINPIPPQFDIAHSELVAYIDAKTGNVRKGLAGLDRAAKSESQLPYTDPAIYPRPVLELLGRTALDAHDFQTAESAYRRALENEPGGGRALWGLAKALEGLGSNDDAQKTLKEFRRVWRGEELK
ncbi:MAG: tetratricopeptide repeat protein [Acidobacteria bacterium]|nr:tetratricopeptide repeat protein [Acidobacteriota bacterium]